MHLTNFTTVPEAILHVCQHPDIAHQEAIVLDDEKITYTQLLQRAKVLSDQLRVTHNVKVGDIIGQCVERSIDMTVGMFAIILTGAIYCPLNPADPIERLLTIIKETHVRVVLTHLSTKDKFSNKNPDFVTVNIQREDHSNHDLPSVSVDPRSVAYIITTSGTTGKPKTVQVTHDSFFNSVNGFFISNMYSFGRNRLLQMARCSFDLHIFECLSPLTHGGTCVMLKPHGNLDLAYVASIIHRHQVNIACFVPAFLYALHEHLQQTNQFHLLSSMRQIVFGGEACRAARIAPIFAILSQPPFSIDLINLYGPTETSLWTTYHKVTQEDLDRNMVPIGVPLPNYTCYNLDEDLSPVSVDKLGELYIGGRGVFPGYFGDDERVKSLNKKVLVRLPFEKNLCYRTGDLCRLSENGEILYCGRTDHQVKLRGQRIEISEIEECILQVEGITNCVVVKQTNIRNQQDFLVAFVQSRNFNNIENLRESIIQQCRQQLPAYMIPSIIKVMDKLPLNVNGKVDRSQLPDVSDLIDDSIEHISPRTELESYVHGCWSDLLCRSDISVLGDLFSMGGDSILCMKLLSTFKMKFNVVQMTIRDLFTANTIEQQAKLLEMASPESSVLSVSSPLYRSGRSRATASHAQQRIYLDEQLRFSTNDPNILSVYSIPIGTRIEEGELVVDRLKKSLHELIQRHEILRTTYKWNDEIDILEQCVHSHDDDNYEEVEWCINESNILNSINRRFDLTKGPLVRCNIILNENNQVESFIICIHHIAFDGASISIFCSELKSLYNEKLLTPLSLQYIDYTLQIDQIRNEDDAIHRQFWINTLDGYINNELLLPFDRLQLSARNRTGAAGVIHYTFSPILLAQMKTHRESNQMTLFMQLLTIYQIFLARLTDQSDICVGSVNANRPRAELDQLIGFFVNTLPYRIQISLQDDTFQTLCLRVKQMCLDVLEHANFPYDEIVQLHRTNQNQNQRTSLFQTLFLYEDIDQFQSYVNFSDDTYSSIRTTEYNIDVTSTMFDLQLLIQNQTSNDKQDHLSMSFIYAQDVFHQTTVQQIMDRFTLLIHNLFINNTLALPIAQCSIILPHEQKLTDQLIQTKIDFGPRRTVHEAILATCHNIHNIHQPAVLLDDQQITYSQLLQRAQALATYLSTTYHIKIGEIIGQCVERSIDMTVGMFAIILTGAIYCPLNPADPIERLLTIVKETRTRIILTHLLTIDKFSNKNPDFVTVNIQREDHSNTNYHDLPPLSVDPRSVAFLINTSGSTGKPKTVQLTHDNFFNTFYGYQTAGFACVPQYRLLQIAGCSFDLHIVECLAPLIHGSTCVMLKPHGNLDLAYVASIIHRHQVNNAALVPSFLYALYEHLQRTNQFYLLSSMRQIVFGGEACHVARIATISAVLSQPPLSIELLNAYGPAETCFTTTYHRLTQEDLDRNVIPIGVPLPNCRCYILDEHFSQIPVNKLGELYIGGRGVFPGYFGDDERVKSLNKKVLVRLPFEKNLCYRTGDLCRLSENGEILYCGRTDHQVKLRGQRIEISEIEECILQVEGITNCVVVKQTNIRNQQDFLVAFVQSRNLNNIENLRESIIHQCRQQLPSYMIPSIIKVMDKLPLNANDKVDRKQLPDVEFFEEYAEKSNNMLPSSELERLVHAEWRNILGLPELPINADFFASGGNSLMLMRLLSAYQASGLVKEEKPITIVSLFEQTTIADHVKLLQLPSSKSSMNQCKTKEQWQPLHVNESIASLAQQRIWLDEHIRFSKADSSAMYNIPMPLVIGKNNKRISVTRLRRALFAIIRKHKVLRTRIQNEVTEKGGIIQQSINPMPQYFEDNIFSEQLCYTDEQVRLALTAEVTQQHFSIDDGHVIRCHILRRRSALGEDDLVEEDIIVFNIHHIAFDGASRTVFLRDIQLAYEDESTFLDTNIDNEFQYIDYSIHESNLLSDTSPISYMNKAREYWKSTLKDSIDNQLFSTRTTTTNKMTTNMIGANLSFTLPIDLSTMFVKLAASNNMTLFQLFLACYQLFLCKVTRQTDICVGGVLENRYRPELEQLIGMFVNILPYRTIIDRSKKITLHDFFLTVQRLCLGVLQHGHLPFQDIIQLHRDPQHQYQSPFFQAIILLESYKSDDIACFLNEVPCKSIEPPISVAKYDLSLVVQHNTTNNDITCRWEYSTQLFDEDSIAGFSDRFVSLLTQVVDKQKQEESINDLHILQSYEQKMLHALNDTHVNFNSGDECCIAAVFDANAQQDPTRTCVVLDDDKLTYAQMRDYSNQFADYLVHQCGVKPGDIVMQCVQRSIDMVIGILAILKACATYCPLNPDHPAARHVALIDDTHARFIVCHHSTHAAFSWTATHKRPITLINISTSLIQTSIKTKSYSSTRSPNKPDNYAYVIFTSGSTGKPKAVPVRHDNFFACIRACQHLNIFGSTKETVLQVSQCSFDIHLLELLGCMITGGTLVMLKPLGNMDMDYLSQTIAKQCVTWAIFTPTITALLVEFIQDNSESVNRLHSLRIWASVGEALVPNTVIKLRQYLASDAKIYNLYGPAECTLLATYHLVTSADLNANLVPIGIPLSNYTCYILDEDLSPVPVNTLGELYIGGAGVFTGYLGDGDTIQALNKKALVSLPRHDQKHLFYRTGDLCRLSNDVKIIYVGRTDHQVKIRGQRLELGEVEASLIDPDVTCCAVVKHVDETSNEEYLSAYIQPKEHVQSTEYDTIQTRILNNCRQILPAFMIPTAWLIMKKLPLTATDKIDRNQLPKISRTSPTTTGTLPSVSSSKHEVPIAGSHPLMSIEDQVCDIFSQALNINFDKNQVDVPFGQLGGTSLTAMTIVTLIRQRLYKPMEIGMLFEHPTARQLAAKLTQLQTSQLQNVNKTDAIPMNNDTVINLDSSNKLESINDKDERHEKNYRTLPYPSLRLETIGVILLIYCNLYPLWISLKIIQLMSIQSYLFQRNPSGTYLEFWWTSVVQFSLLLFLIPIIQLSVYLICKWLLLGRVHQGEYRLYSCRYYCHWFVHRLWVLNRPLLTAIVGTPFYNLYLRMCGARIGRNVHINTTLIDTPDLLSIDDYTYIANDVVLASLSYYKTTYKLDLVQIDSYCSIQTRSVLQHGVHMEYNVLVKSMSFVSGTISMNSTVDGTAVQLNNRILEKDCKNNLSLSWMQTVYQNLCVLFVNVLQIIVPSTAFATYRYLFPQISTIYFSVFLPILWIISLLFNVILCAVILRILVGHVCNDTTHPINSWYFIHKLWLRQLVVNTFGGSFFIFNAYHRLYPVLLRWFGARLGSDADIFDFGMLLSGPSNLITAGKCLTTNSSCVIVPIDVVDGKCTTQQVNIGDGVMFGNEVVIHGGASIPDQCLIGSMTRVYANEQFNKDSIVLGVPARELPISNVAAAAPEKQILRSLPLCTRIWRVFTESFIETVLVIVLNKLLVAMCGVCFVVYFFLDNFSGPLTVTNIFLFLPPLYLLFMILFSIALCISYRVCNSDIWQRGNYPFEKLISWRRHLIWAIMADYYTFAATFLGGTQWLVFVLRGCGARIGQNVILSNFHNLIDLQFITLDDCVRIHDTAIVQCHTFEHRLFQLAPSHIGQNSILDHFSVTFPDCMLEGNNHVYPCTLILKGDQVPKGTAWKGNPSKQEHQSNGCITVN